MDLSNILSISGKNGLYRLISQNKSSFVVESLDDKKRFPAFHNDGISSLDNISVYTHEETIDLKKVFQIIFAKKEMQSIEFKNFNNEEIKKSFKDFLPEYDEDRCFVSHIKKIFTWYNILQKNNLITLEESQPLENSNEALES